MPELSEEDDCTELQHWRLPELHVPPVWGSAIPATTNVRATIRECIIPVENVWKWKRGLGTRVGLRLLDVKEDIHSYIRAL